MLAESREFLQSYFLYIKFLHVMVAMPWAFSTTVAWAFYLKPAFRRVADGSDDAEAIAQRNRYMELFDRGAIVEHVCFPILVATALLMIWINQHDLSTWNYVSAKFAIGAFIFVPIEVVDYYLAHFGGNKAAIRRSGDMAKYERFIGHHWLFLRITEPIVIVFVPLVVFLAVLKPF